MPRKSRSQAIERLSVADRHQLKIARDTLRYNDVMVAVLGGMTKEQAREIITRMTGKRPND
jgi:hypothetical protein